MAGPSIEYEDFEEALKGCVSGEGFTDHLTAWVSEVLFANQGNRKLQWCLAGILREVKWTCTPPQSDGPSDKRRARAVSIVDTIVASTQSGAGGASDEATAEAMAERLEVPEALVWLAVDGVDIEKIDEFCQWWPANGGA